ncbi:MAG: HAMP domain-containing histidine kinase [Verrucomicrobia bacterium]|nr:HAMP domain-containing histidine kinase [Verrucomicrobiota bacterium]MDE3099673.1 HAMP domain-containing histidine kinase [Verrucomicrobiota bacterium]
MQSLIASVDEMTRLIKSVSLLARASAAPVRKEKIAMGDIVSDVWQRLERQILEKDASVHFPASWPQALGAPAWVKFIWSAFLSNALQYGGRRIHAGWRASNRRFFVEDDGPGVPDAVRGHLFQPFELLHRPDGARGLSLSIVLRLVQLQGGQCGHEPVSPHGACFYFTLPAE